MNSDEKEKWKERFLYMLALSVPLYIILFTAVGSILFSFFLGLVVDPLVPAQHKDKMCDISNSIVATLQPLVSDEKMLDFFERNRVDMQALANLVHEKKNYDQQGRPTKALAELQEKLRVHAGQSISWSSAPYSMEEVQKMTLAWNRYVIPELMTGQSNQKNCYGKRYPKGLKKSINATKNISMSCRSNQSLRALPKLFIAP